MASVVDSERGDPNRSQPAADGAEARRREFIRRLAKAAVIPAVVVAVNSSISPAKAGY